MRNTLPFPSHTVRRQGVQYNVKANEFVWAWQTSETAAEVAERLGMPRPIVYARASSYRKRGVRLKKLKRSSPRGLNTDALNRLADALAG